MIKRLLAITIAILLGSNFSQAQDKTFDYVGVKSCGICHKTAKQGEQLKIWENSLHAKAYKTLQTAEADKIAKEKGFDTKAVETENCLKCHATAYNLPDDRKDKKFDVADGVQCETCHGPGSEYKSMKVMRDHDLAVKNGMTEYKDEAAIEKQCVSCHNEESPTYKPFDFKTEWAKIKHPVPAGK